jgi:pentatricopeptide repeat protein
MLALFRPRRLLASVPLRQTRSIRSTPREIPTYLKRWDPTLHKPPRSPPLPAEANNPQNVVPDDVVRVDKRTWQQKRLRDKKLVHIPFKNRSPDQIHSVRNLIRLLHLTQAGASPDFSLSTQLWNAYCAATKLDSDLSLRIPERAWDVLWNAQNVHGYSRKKRLPRLEHDLSSVGVTTVGQRVQSLEDLFLEGKEEEALKAWEGDHSQPARVLRQDYKPEHLEMGVKLHALAGNTDRARQVMKELFELYPNSSPSIMMSVFRAHTSSGVEEKHDVAKEIYIEMRERMGASFTVETYDACLIGFLEARCLQHAKQVFRDMCKDGHLATSGDAGSVEEVLKRLHLLYRLGTDISKMTSIVLDAISILPVSYHGHIFGSWMKCAVIENAPEAAAQILDMMFQRGFKPEVFHFNLLLRALLRTKETSKILQAENIGWRMVERAKLEVIETDRIPHGPARYIESKLNNNDLAMEGPKHAMAPEAGATMAVPNASVTTFGIIMQHHAKNSQWEHVDYLARQLNEAGLTPNTVIMNVLIDSKCRQGRFSEAWMIYKSLTDNPDAQNVFPNGKTIRSLWKMLRFALGEQTQTTPEYSSLPTPRALLAETVRWWEMCRSRYDAERFRQGLAAADHGAIMGLMMHCFSYKGDLPGCLVALHVLRHKFDILPNDKTFDIIKRQMAWVDLRNETESVRLQFTLSGAHKRNTQYVEALFQKLLEQRMKSMDVGSDIESSFSHEELGDIGLNLFSELVRAFMKKTYEPATVEAMIDAVKDEVGVPDMKTGDTTPELATPSR